MARYLGRRIEDRSVVDSLVLDLSGSILREDWENKGMHALIIAKPRAL